MSVLPIVAVGIMMKLTAVLFIITAIALILIIMIQKGRGGGLSAAFGGAGGGGLMGSKTGDFLTWVTIVLAGVFLLLTVVLAKWYRPTVSDYGSPAPQQQQQPAGQQQVPPTQSLPEMPAETLPQTDVNNN